VQGAHASPTDRVCSNIEVCSKLQRFGTIHDLVQRVIVNITTTDGRNFSEQLDYPKGDPRNPLSDAEIEEKFRALAEGVLSARAQDKLIDAIWNLEKCASVTKLMALMKADVKKKAKAKAVTKRH